MQIGTYLMADPGADYGAKGLIQSMESSNALRDGGVFAYRSVGPRKMAFPLLLRDVSGQTLLQTESLLREWTTAGAAVAVQPETIPSGQAVFFDVLDGRWEPDYDTFENRAGRRKGTLFLDTQPWGYWPTEMLLASSASVGFYGQLTVNGASVLGDVSPLAHVSVIPTAASFYPNGTLVRWQTDMLGLSFGARPSFTPFLPMASWSSLLGFYGAPSLAGDKFAPASQAQVFTSAFTTTPNFVPMLAVTIPSALEPAYRGRFRAFGFFKGAGPSNATAIFPFQMIVDAERSTGTVWQPLATSNQIATAYTVIEQAGQPLHWQASPAYDILDLGEITLPPQASGVQGPIRLRNWLAAATANNVATYSLFFGGLFLLPVDGAAGIQTRGLSTPTISGDAVRSMPPTQAGFEANQNFVEQVSIVQAPGVPYADGRSWYRGVPLRIGATTNSLTMLSGDRYVSNGAGAVPTSAVVQANLEWSSVSISYRPTFQFLSGL